MKLLLYIYENYWKYYFCLNWEFVEISIQFMEIKIITLKTFVPIILQGVLSLYITFLQIKNLKYLNLWKS